MAENCKRKSSDRSDRLVKFVLKELHKESNGKTSSPVDVIDCELKRIFGGNVLFILAQSWKHILESDFEKGFQYCQIALDFVWEKLNTGYWKDVDVKWRQAYTVASLFKVISQAGNCESKDEIFKSCDLGLMMGAPILGNILSKITELLQDEDYSSKFLKKDGILDERSFTSNDNACGDSNVPMKKKKAKLEIDNDKTDIQFSRRNEIKEDDLSDDIELKAQLADEIQLDKEKLITRIKNPSLENFYSNYMLKSKPVIIEGAINHWPAMTTRQWSVDYIKKIAGHRTVPIEIGERYTSEDWTQKLLTINEFIEKFILKDDGKGYLAQHQLFDQVPDLRKDIFIPDYCCLSDADGRDSDVIINAWFGPGGTVSPLHHDPYSNVFAQIVGRKYIRIYDQKYSENVYAHESYLLDNTSQVDVESPDLEKFPLFAEAPYWECIVKEGDLLFIPKKFWHYVKSLSLSFSVSFWW